MQQYLQRENHLKRKTFYTCLLRLWFRYLQSSLELRWERDSIVYTDISLRNWLARAYPHIFAPILSIEPSRQHLCILYLLLIQSLPLMENMVQLLGWGWCSLFGIARGPEVVRCCPSAISILSTLFLQFFSMYQICCFLDDVAITSICTYIKYNIKRYKKNIFVHLVFTRMVRCILRINWKHRSIYSICFSLEESIHLSNLDSHLDIYRNRRVDQSTNPHGPCLGTTKHYIHLTLTPAVLKPFKT